MCRKPVVKACAVAPFRFVYRVYNVVDSGIDSVSINLAGIEWPKTPINSCTACKDNLKGSSDCLGRLQTSQEDYIYWYFVCVPIPLIKVLQSCLLQPN